MLCTGISSSCSTNDTRRVTLVTNPLISHEWGKDPISVVICNIWCSVTVNQAMVANVKLFVALINKKIGIRTITNHRYLLTGPSPLFLEHRFFFSCKQHFATLYVSLDDIYNKYKQTVVSIHTVFLTCI